MSLQIDAISDLHGHTPELPGGDLLIVAGDCTASGTEWRTFYDWLADAPYDFKILVGGNHDGRWTAYPPTSHEVCCDIIYLQDGLSSLETIRIWGSPWTPRFNGQHPKAMAFTDKRENMAQYWDKIPEGLDILVTHGPSYGHLDRINSFPIYEIKESEFIDGHIGDLSLDTRVKRIKPRIHLFGHCHEQGGRQDMVGNTRCYNVSCVNESYELVRGATRIEI